MKQTAMQQLKDKIQTAISELNGEITEYQSGYKQCLVNMQNDIDAQMLEIEKEQITKACHYGYYIEEMYDVRNYYNETFKSE